MDKIQFIKLKHIVEVHAQPSMPPAMVHIQTDSPDVWYNKLGLSHLENKYLLPLGLLKYVIEIESKGNPNARSGKGASGLFGIMPAAQSGFTGDPLNHIEAAHFAAKTLSSLKQHFGNWGEALAAYNWGRGNVIRKGIHNAPEETKNYLSFFKSKGIPLHTTHHSVNDVNRVDAI